MSVVAVKVAFLGEPETQAPSPKNTPEPKLANLMFFSPLVTSILPLIIISILSPVSFSLNITVFCGTIWPVQYVAIFLITLSGIPTNNGLFLISWYFTLIFLGIVN